MKRKDTIGELRPNQVITTFGPGAIVDAKKDSVTVLDLSYWKEKGRKIIDGRLASYLKVDNFYSPSVTGVADVPIISFPKVHICSKCGRIFSINETKFDIMNYLRFGVSCPDCGGPAYPSRFIVMCEDGHLDDFPWRWWAHHGESTCQMHMKLRFSGFSSTLADMRVECGCGAKRSLSGATQMENFTELSCSGHHPFRPSAKDRKCSKAVVPSQRGASNVYFSVTRSAISIPPWVNPLYMLIDTHMDRIKTLIEFDGDEGVDKIYKKYFSQYSRPEFDEALRKRLAGITDYTEFKQMEYDAITHHNDPVYSSNKMNFKAEEEPVPFAWKRYISRVIKISRLREVLVLEGFTRVSAPDPDAEAGDQPHVLNLHSGEGEKWLPAVVKNGEGVFIEFNKKTIDEWLSIPSVASISNRFKECYQVFCESKGWNIRVPRDAVYVLIHTFSHLLIKQMALHSGYSSAAINEKIYFGPKMNGLLLHTGSADAEGSLGGLVELGNFNKLSVLIMEAFNEALLCTNDPECMTHLPDNTDADGAACHSCTMVSETACENGNRLLDRGVVVPLKGREEQSYFKELVGTICKIKI